MAVDQSVVWHTAFKLRRMNITGMVVNMTGIPSMAITPHLVSEGCTTSIWLAMGTREHVQVLTSPGHQAS